MSSYRAITSDELPLFAELSGRSFRYDPQRTVDNLSRPEWRYGLDSLFIYEDDARGAVAGMVVFNRGISVGGELLEADMVASVSVPPDQRRRGYGNAMMSAGLRRARERGTALSILWPYSIPFYNRLGYGIFTYGNLLELPLAEMVNFEEGRLARRMTEADLPAMQRLYTRELKRRSGLIARSEYEWRARIFENEGMTWPHKLEGAVVPGEGDELLGYVVYALTYWEGNPKECLIVYEWVYDSDQPAGFRALAGYAAAQRAQAKFLRYTAPLDSALPHAFEERYSQRTERHTEFIYRDTGIFGPGMLGRLVHAPQAFKQRGYPAGAKGACAVRVVDKELPENGTPFLLEVEGGKGYVFEDRSSSTLTATADVRTWSELYANTLTPAHARLLGRLEADSATVEFLTLAFTSAPWFIHRADWF